MLSMSRSEREERQEEDETYETLPGATDIPVGVGREDGNEDEDEDTGNETNCRERKVVSESKKGEAAKRPTSVENGGDRENTETDCRKSLLGTWTSKVGAEANGRTLRLWKKKRTTVSKCR